MWNPEQDLLFWGPVVPLQVIQFVHKITWPGWNLAHSSYSTSQMLAPWPNLFVNPQKALSICCGDCVRRLIRPRTHNRAALQIYTSGNISQRCHNYSYRDTQDWKQKTESSFDLHHVPLQTIFLLSWDIQVNLKKADTALNQEAWFDNWRVS